MPLSRKDPSGSPASSALLGEERDLSKEWAEESADLLNPSAASLTHAVVFPEQKQSTLPIRENHLFRSCSIAIVI